MSFIEIAKKTGRGLALSAALLAAGALAAAREYAEDVRHGRFPAEEHTYPGPKRAKATE